MRWFTLWLLVFLLAACGMGPATPEAPQQSTAPAIEIPISPAGEEAATAPATPVEDVNEPDYAFLREKMVELSIIGWGIEDQAVIEVMGLVPRHEFVPADLRPLAYNNHPLPIGHGQTISQPYIVALMTQAIEPEAGDKVLEIGTGSGYQAAILAELVDHVYSMEIIGPLAESATAVLTDLGYDNVTVRHADGYFGWEEEAPFDAIIVTAAPDHVPPPLIQQLKIGGRMIIPVGPVGGFQKLWLVTRESEDEVNTVDLGGVQFVPLTREES